MGFWLCSVAVGACGCTLRLGGPMITPVDSPWPQQALSVSAASAVWVPRLAGGRGAVSLWVLETGENINQGDPRSQGVACA